MILAVAFSVSGALALVGLTASFFSENPHLLPSLPSLPSLRRAPAALPADRYFCEASRRWRCVATKRFMAAPAA